MNRLKNKNKIAIAFLALLLAGCQNKEASNVAETPTNPDTKTPEGITLEGETLKLANLEIATATQSSSAERLTVTGMLEADPAATAIVTSRVEGKIIRLTPNVGDVVPAASVVAIIESEKLHEAQLNYALLVKKLDAHKADLMRRRQLARLGAYGRPGVDEARKYETEARGAFERAQSDIRNTETAIAESKTRLAAQDAKIEQARTAEKLATSNSEFADKQVVRSEKLLFEQIISKQEHEQTLSAQTKARAELDHTRTEIRAEQARRVEVEAGIASATSRRDGAQKAQITAQKQLTLAKQALTRGEAIYKGGYLTSKEVAEAEAAVTQAQVSVEGALNDIQLLGGQSGDNHSIPIAAPFSGRVLERKATLGQTVMAGEVILTLVNPRTLFAQLALFPADLTHVRVGQEVALTIAGRKISGVVEHLGEQADETTRAVKVRVRVENASGGLRPGMPVTATISKTTAQTILVPAGAIQTQGGKKVVFVPSSNKPGEFIARSVEVGITQDGKSEIRSGLKPGEKFVAKNAFLVKSQSMKSELGGD
jgi:RND family efflux transporter MFP subunit